MANQSLFKVIKPGILSTLQDNGRAGYLHLGISESGALDEYAYYWGNYLLDNPPGSASVEITIGQCALLSLSDSIIAVTGANLNFCINAQTMPTWSSLVIKAGDRLTWQRPNNNGIRAYLSVSGGFAGPSYFNSRSVNLRENIGHSLKAADILQSAQNGKPINYQRKTPRHFISNYQSELYLRLLINDYDDFFSQKDYQTFFAHKYRISIKNDRSAYQLERSAIRPKKKTFYSQANHYGSVQITTNGTPIIMLRDRPSIGGYGKIGSVFSLDLAQLSQRSSGDIVQFLPTDIETMQSLRQIFERFFNKT